MEGAAVSDRDIVDRIDELVDEQLANYDRRTGYDYSVGQDRCAHCGDEWHGLPITETVRSMRSRYGYDPRVPVELDSYRADGDESAVWCPGSTFVGPWANPAQLARIRAGTTGVEAWSLPENPFEPGRWTLPELSFPGPDHPHYRYSRGEQLRLARQEDTRGETSAPTRERGWSLAELESLRRMMSTQNPGAPWLRTGGRRNGRHTAIPGGRAPDTVRDALARLQATIAEIYDECSVPVRSWTLGDPEPGTPEPELDDRGRPRPPRPSTTPPMWANNPTRTNRRRNR